MPLYFAYGANMALDAMARRCPRSKPLAVARLPHHRFFVSTDGYASVKREPHAVVWGLLWDLALSDVRALDLYEDVGRGLYTKTFLPVIHAGGAKRAMIYVGRSLVPGAPRPGYLEAVVAAAEAADLPADALLDLRRWLPSTAPAARRVDGVTPRAETPFDR